MRNKEPKINTVLEMNGIKKRKSVHWKRLLSVVTIIAVFCTTYILILPAITMERCLICEIPEHTHEDSCYSTITVPEARKLVCNVTKAVHTHDENCYSVDGALICKTEELEAHTHGDGCFDSDGALICEKEETILHTHSSECYAPDGTLICTLEELEEHQHGDSCFENIASHEEKILVCGQVEHTHSDSCFDAVPQYDDGYICGLVEHSHSSSCYSESATLTCTMTEHTHTTGCMKSEGNGLYNSTKLRIESLISKANESVSSIYNPALNETINELLSLRNEIETYASDGKITEGQRDILCGEIDAYIDSVSFVAPLSDVSFLAGATTIKGTATVAAEWNGSEIADFFTATFYNTLDKATVSLQYSDDSATWNNIVTINKPPKNRNVTLTDNGTVSSAPLTRQWRIYETAGTKTGIFGPFTVYDILESIKPGFSNWLADSYVQLFGGTALPTTVSELYTAFGIYYSLPELTLSTVTDDNDVMYIDASTNYSGSVAYRWEVLGEDGQWSLLTASTSSEINASELLDGVSYVRCSMYEAGEGGQLLNVSTIKVNPLQKLYDETIAKINSGLGLSSYPVTVATAAATTINVDVSIFGERYNNYFYWTNLANDPRVPFYDGVSYAEYLASEYLKYTDETEALNAVRTIWKTYLYDMYDPAYDSGNIQLYGSYPEYTYGDQEIGFIKDKNNTSFHSTNTLLPVVNDLDYDFLDNGVDYANFVSKLEKTTVATAPGDEKEERKYLVDLNADAQAMTTAPVAMILQIQTSWQMFDLLHANALIGEGYTQKGAVAYNTELANIYAIKQALLRFVDYMENEYPGNNLVLGITETRHDATQTMFLGTDDNGNPLYVTNDYGILREAIRNWDSFGNCEHVHYKTTDLENAVENIASNLEGWKDFYGNEILYSDIQKVAVIIGGPTELDSGTNGYGCTLPWGTFTTSGINSVYGIRCNNGTSYVHDGSANDGIISWIDYSLNNTGTPYENGVGTAFTEKYVATTEDAVLNKLIQIAEKEMLKKGYRITAQDKYVDDVTVNDTVCDEFEIDYDVPFSATVYNEDGVTKEYETVINPVTNEITMYKYTDGAVSDTQTLSGTKNRTVLNDGTVKTVITFTETQEFPYEIVTQSGNIPQVASYTGPQTLTVCEKPDGTTEVEYNFGRVFNTNKYHLDFGIIAREDYLGSNNVYSNVGTPFLDYEHHCLDNLGVETGEIEYYTRNSYDTPEVNVPIRFATVDGDRTRVLVDTPVQLADLSEAIALDAQDRVDNYDQTNGVLSYVWVYPDGTEYDVGSVRVTDGSIGEAEFPSRESEFIPNAAGNYSCVLKVKFTPDDIDESNKNFCDDTTKVAVNPLEKPGRVWIEAIDSKVTVDKYVKKVWDAKKPEDIVPITFRLLKNGVPATDSNGDILTYTLSAENNWEIHLTGLAPTMLDSSGEQVIIDYSVEEVDVPHGYKPIYEESVRSVDNYLASLYVKFTPTANINADKAVTIYYTYDGISYTYTIAKNTHEKYLAGTEYTVKLGDGFSLDENGEPFAAEFIKATVGKNTYTNGSVIAEKYVASTENYTELIITNTPSNVDLTVSKTVLGTSSKIKFNFEAQITGEAFPAPAEGAGYTVDENGIAHFSLANGESVTLTGIPEGSEVTVRELNHDGFSTYVRSGDVTVSDTDTLIMTLDENTSVEYVNTTGCKLPATGAGGTAVFYILGALLIAGASCILIFQKRIFRRH